MISSTIEGGASVKQLETEELQKPYYTKLRLKH